MSKRPNLMALDPVQIAQAKRDKREAESIPPDSIVPDGIPSAAIPPQTIAPDSIPLDSIPAPTIPSQPIPPKSIPRRGRPSGTIPKNGIPPETIPADGMPPVSIAKGYYQAFNDLDDRIMPTLDAFTQVVLRRLYRLSHGYGQTRCKVGLGALAVAANISRSTVQKAIPQLIEKGLIAFVEGDSLGTVYEILPGVKPVRSHGIPSKGIPPGKGSVPSDNTEARHGIPRGGNDKQYKDLNNTDKRELETIEGLNTEDAIQMYRDLLARDYTLEKLRAQFRAAHSTEEWETIERELESSRGR